MNTENWKWFRYDEIFEIRKGKRLTTADMEVGNIRYIGAIDSHNGVSNYISNDEHIHESNTITVSYNGSVGFAYYQDKPFWATDDVNVLYPKFPLNVNIALFLCTMIEKEQYRYNYGRKWTKDIMEKSIIKLPTTENGQPDWQWMEDYAKNTLLPQLPMKTRQVWEKKYNNQPLSSKKLELKVEEWKWFRYDEIFEIKKGFFNKKPEESGFGTIPFIGATDSNNGVTSWYTIDEIDLTPKAENTENVPLNEKIFESPCITVSNNGSVGYAFYQTQPFTCSHDVNPLYLKDRTVMLTPSLALFLCGIIECEQFRWTYGRKWRPERMPNSLIKLPVNENGQPDWQWMEDYIKGLPYSGCLEQN